jgi:hypothetical protein
MTPELGASARSAERRGMLRRYVDAFRIYADAGRDDEEARLGWSRFVAQTLAMGLLLALGLRLFQAWSLDGPHAPFNWIAVVTGALLAGSCIGLLLWTYWGIHFEPGRERPYKIAFLSALVAILVCTEAFAGLTTLLWQRGHLASTTDLEPGLWRSERHYLWHLANAVPLLDIPATLGWKDPNVFASPWSGSLLLLFKALVIVPLVQVAIAGYRLVEGRWLAARTGTRYRPAFRRDHFEWVDAEDAWWFFATLLWMTPVAIIGLLLLDDPPSFVDRWTSAHLPDALEAGRFHVPLASVHAAVDCLIAAGLVWLFLALAAAANLPALLRLDSFTGVCGALAAYLALLPFMVVAAGATTLALLQLDVASARPAIPAQGEAAAAIDWYAWHLAEAIPFLDIPGALGWTLDHEFVDHSSGGILLAIKIIFFTVLVVPVLRLVRSAAHELRPHRPSGQLDAPDDLMRLIRQFHLELDAAQNRILAETLHPAPARNADVRGRLVAARAVLENTEEAFARVSALFGRDNVTGAAKAALTAATNRLEETIKWSDRAANNREDARNKLDAVREEAIRRAAEFERLAVDALRHAASRTSDR